MAPPTASQSSPAVKWVRAVRRLQRSAQKEAHQRNSLSPSSVCSSQSSSSLFSQHSSFFACVGGTKRSKRRRSRSRTAPIRRQVTTEVTKTRASQTEETSMRTGSSSSTSQTN
ncbi:hypothetical protein NP493_6052g00009 [Ridgeia piscesae]|uniref:Uncharacterized protein n=1 Tax=Ridgeia piscesae TaxID=27915 RepID=A0AAD9ISQ9_RIDPI|nr:hypothetical protein NP493_6052g00009 [Ridgeia piscesae]